jgi:ubiquinone/menaquinone biosynthesis C-methylase UbiE
MTAPAETTEALTLFDTLAANYEASIGGCTREVATHLISLLPPVDSTSSVLDNACGNGIVAQELLFRYSNTPLSITCVDGAKAMVDLARHAVPPATSLSSNDVKISFDVMDGTNLTLPNEVFTHSVTNMGLFFFPDPQKGAGHIYRTLKPGGIAIVTSWKSAGYLPVIHEAQRAVRPDDPLFKWPIPDVWFQGTHLQQTLEGAGFKDVQMSEKTVHYAAAKVEVVCEYLMGMWKNWGPNWSEEETEAFGKKLLEVARREAVEVKRPVNGKDGADMLDVAGLPMVAHVAVARK